MLRKIPFLFSLLLAAGLYAQNRPLEIQAHVKVPFQFVAFGDTRFTDPANTQAANAAVRHAMVDAIDRAHPDFVSFGGDIVFIGGDGGDWKVYDRETSIWHEHNLTMFPVIGNHELKGSESSGLASYFEHFPVLQGNRYYSVRAGNALLLNLDSSQPEASGPQGSWLSEELETLPSDVGFVFFVLHHPPLTTSAEGVRPPEAELAKMIESYQQHVRARFVVLSAHVHNYERHERKGVLYLVSGGGGAHAKIIERSPDDPFQSHEVNYHYLSLAVSQDQLSVTMNRLDVNGAQQTWTQPDSVTVRRPAQGESGTAKPNSSAHGVQNRELALPRP
jgi:hypothetical protein